jgi:hypothetical protein
MASTYDRSILSSGSDKNIFNPANGICEAHNCGNGATIQIEVHVGKFGTIPLSLCMDCVSLFEVNRDKSRELTDSPKKTIGGISHQPTKDRMEQSKIIPKQTTLRELL